MAAGSAAEDRVSQGLPKQKYDLVFTVARSLVRRVSESAHVLLAVVDEE